MSGPPGTDKDITIFPTVEPKNDTYSTLEVVGLHQPSLKLSPANNNSGAIISHHHSLSMTVPKHMRPLRVGESQWIFDVNDLCKTPSTDAGFTYEQELEERKRTILFMRSLWLRVAG